MSVFLITLLKNMAGYLAGKLLKPEHTTEFILDIADIVADRTDTEIDDKTVKKIRELLGHEEKES